MIGRMRRVRRLIIRGRRSCKWAGEEVKVELVTGMRCRVNIPMMDGASLLVVFYDMKMLS